MWGLRDLVSGLTRGLGGGGVGGGGEIVPERFL